MVDDDTRHRLATEFVGGLLAGDDARMRAVLHPEASWSIPGATAVSGTVEGAEAVVERARAIVAGGVSVELVRVLYGEANVAVALHNTGERGDAVLDEHLTTVFTIVDGRIGPIETLISDVAGLNAFFEAGG